MGVLTQQPQGAVVVNRGNQLGRDLSFLWTGSNPFQDLTGDAVTVSSVNGQVIFNRGTERGLAMFSTTSGAVTRTFFKTRNINTSAYTTTIGAVFRVARLTGTSYVFGVVNALSFYQRIGINDTGNVTVDVATAPSTFITLVSDNTYAVGDWLSVVATVVSGSIVFYVNGVKQTQTYTGTVSNQNYPRIEWGVSRGDSLLCFAAPVIWDESEVNAWSKNPWQLFSGQLQLKNKLLTTLSADFDDINAATTETPIPVPRGSGIKQFLGQATVNRGNSFGRNTQFLWSAAAPLYDATGNYRATNSSDRTNVFSANIFGEPPQITASAEGLQYTGTATPVGAGTGGGIVFRGLNNSSTTGEWAAAPAGRGNGVTVVILGRYTSTASNQRLFAASNQQNSGVTQSFAIVAGKPRLSYTGSYTQTENFAGTTTVPYTLGQVHLTVYVATPQGQFIYVDGKLAGQIGELHYGGATSPGARLAIVPGGMAPIMIAYINKPLTRQEVRQLTANPWQLYRQPQVKNQLLHTYGTDFDTFNNFGKTSYVNYLDLPRKFTPVNKNHGLSKNMLFCWTPAHGTRDGYDPSVPVTGPGGPEYMDWVYGKYARYGHAVTPSRGYISRNFTAGSKTTTSNPLTLLAFVCINQSSYPIISRNLPSATDVLTTPFRVMAGNALSQFDFIILPDGQLSYGIPFVSDSYVLPSGGPGGKVPLNTLVAVAVVVTSSESRFFIDGRYVGSVRRSQGGNYLLAGANILAFVQNSANWSFPFIDCYLAAAWNRNLNDSEIAEFSQHPGQVFLRADRTHDQLTNTFIPDFTAELAPPSRVRSTYLTTASSSDKNNAITSQLLFASSPAHGNADSANAKIAWSTSSDIKVVPGRGGLAWVYGRTQSSLPAANSFNKPLNSTRWTMLSVLSLELDHVSQITPGHYFSGPNWGGNVGAGTKLQIDSNGKILLATTGGTSIYADSVTITPRKVMVVVVTSDGTNTRFYLNGKLVHTSATVFDSGGSVTYQPQRISVTDSVAGTGLRPWYVYLSAMWTRPLQEHEVAKLSQDPYQLFKRPDTANHKILTGQYKYVETDANGRWTPYNERPTYVNYTDLPKTYVPVNKNHPLAKDMIFYSSPAHGFRDAYETDLIWNNPTNNDATGYNEALFQELVHGGYKTYGKAWHIGNKYSAKIASGTKLVRNVSQRTLCAFIYINQDSYPIISFGDYFTSTTAGKSLINGGYTNIFDFGIRENGVPYFGYPAFGVVQPRGGSGGIIPLKQLVAVAVTVTGNLARFYIDGKFIGEQSGAYGLGVDPSFRLVNNPSEIRHTSLQMYLAAGWDRALTDNEIAEFSQHPGQIFQKQHLPREKLLERNFFTDLLPTYPSLPGITKLNRDDRGLYVPKFRVEAGRGADHNPLNTPAQWWYPTPSSGIYVSTFDTTSQKGIYAGYAEARHTPYGVGLKTSGAYEFGAPSLLGDVYASNSVTLVSLFYLQNAKQLTINGRVTALNHRSATSTSLFAQYTNDIGWTNWAGERRVLFAPNRGQYGTSADAEITGVADGLHCAVMHIDRASQQVTCYFDGKLVATKVLGSNTAISYNGAFHYNSYFESLSANNIGSILFASQLINQPFNSQQLSVLSKDPLPYFFKDSYQLKTDLLTKKLKYVETDANGIWTPYNQQSTYVNTVALPKTYIPVNKNHPLTKTMLYCTTPAHGSRDAYNQEMIWSTRAELANNYTDWNSPYWHGVAARGGRAWQNKGYASRSTTYFKPPLIITSTVYTMLQFLSLETNSYPLAGEIPLMGHGYASANHLRIDKWGQLSLSYPYNGPSEIATVSGSRRVPLRRVVCVAATRTPSGTTLYIDGQKLGTVPQAPRWEVGGAADQFVHAVGTTGGGDNASISTHYVYMSAMWHRALSDQEIASLSQNPGQIFLHYERFKRIYPEATPEEFFNKFFLFFG